MTVRISEDVPEQVTRWRCPFCRRRAYAQRSRAAAHMARCWLNPAARGCKTCTHYDYTAGQPCAGAPPHFGCEDGSEDCAAGLDLSAGLRTGCPLWMPREESTP